MSPSVPALIQIQLAARYNIVKYCGLGPNMVIRGLDPSILSSIIIFLFTSRSCARSRFTSFTYVLRYIFTLNMFFCK